ncbi:DUF413 domain-containing protein [Vibrio amylolyticus]|uniref:DUF413 domain-containing protein n=1 Tax=Vibrio amylolyticus TaxID=2847292 RepID=UPI00354E8E2B
MFETQLRHGKRRFYDMVKFPRGFAKSGDFTLLESEILLVFGETMLALEHGIIAPANSDEKHFVKVMKHPAKARTKHEHAWLKYTRLSRGRRSFHTLNSRSRFQIPALEFDYALNDDEVHDVA